MSIAFDVILAAVMLLSVIIGAKRGFIKTVMSLASTILSVVLALIFAPVLSGWWNGVFRTFFTDRIHAWLTQLIGDSNPLAFFRRMPSALASLLDRFGISAKDTLTTYSSASASGEDPLRTVSNFIAGPIANAVSLALAFILIFIAALIVVHLIFRALDLIAKLPVLKSMNVFGGAVLGVLFGALWVYVLCFAATVIGPTLTVSYPDVFVSGWLEGSRVYSFVAEHLAFWNT